MDLQKNAERCLAGILLDENNRPVVSENKPKWIRPIPRGIEHGEVPVALCSNISILVVIKIGEAVPENKIKSINHSLMLIKTFDFEICEVYSFKKFKFRLKFRYKGIEYDLLITDLVFKKEYKSKPKLLANVKEIFVVLSFGEEYGGLYYKLVTQRFFLACVVITGTGEDRTSPPTT